MIMLVHVMGPNLPVDGPTYHVHAAGCADVQRDPAYRGSEHAEDRRATYDFANLVEVAAFVYDFEDDPEDLVGDFKVFPCAAKLPRKQCEGHPGGPYDPMGETVYCDGSCG